MILNVLKNLFVKEQLFECIIWDGKIMRYQDLSQKQIDDINNKPEYKGWTVTLKKEC